MYVVHMYVHREGQQRKGVSRTGVGAWSIGRSCKKEERQSDLSMVTVTVGHYGAEKIH